MSKSAFRYGFDRDLARTALEDVTLGARVLETRPRLDGVSLAELVAGGRAARAAGALGAKLALRLAGGLLDLGLWREALSVLEADAAGFDRREDLRRLSIARALAMAGELAAARAALAGADPAAAPDLARVLSAVLSSRKSEPPEAADLALELCALGLADLAAQMLAPQLSDPAGAPVAAALHVLRLAAPGTGPGLLEAMAPLYRAEGRAASLAATLTVLAGGEDDGVEPESEGSSARRLLLRACLAEACAAAHLWPAAIRRFDFVGKKWREPPDALCELSRCVGRDLLDARPVRLLPPDASPARAFDLFPYNGEARLLQLKLREMAPWIDRFLLVEADETFPGRPKPLHFRGDPEAAAGELAGRILPMVVERPPPHIDYTWAREFHQKDYGVLGLQDLCRPDDLVILSDADEILDRAAVQGFSGEVAAGALRTFRYFLNCELVSPVTPLKATVTRARFAAAHGWNYLRLGAIRHRRSGHLPNAGWHFSSIGDSEWLAYKMQCTAHEEWSYQDQAFFARFLTKLKKAGGLGADFARREIDDSFPAAIRERREALSDIIL